MDIDQRIDEALRETVESHLDEKTPPGLAEAVTYAVFPGGHRIRPRICLAVARAAETDTPELAMAAAISLELLHCASLVHDDMPCFDNAAIRRGRPSVHAAFGESLALLTGDALIVLGFQALTSAASANLERYLALSKLVGSSVGLPRGIVAGQAWECEPTVDLDTYHCAKTGALFAASTMAGAAAAGVPYEEWLAMGKYLGKAYQVADDLLDLCGDAKAIGKPTGNDKLLDRPNYAREVGVRAANKRLRELVALAEQSIPQCARRDALIEEVRRESATFVRLTAGPRVAA